MSIRKVIDDASAHMGTMGMGCIMALIAFVLIGGIVSLVYELIQFVVKQPGFQDGMVIAVVIIYVLIRFAILAVKILIPYFILRFLIKRFGWSKKLYYLLIAIGIVAIVTSGSGYRQYRRENPSIVTEWNKDLDEAPSILERFVHYEAYRMIYDLERITPEIQSDREKSSGNETGK